MHTPYTYAHTIYICTHHTPTPIHTHYTTTPKSTNTQVCCTQRLACACSLACVLFLVFMRERALLSALFPARSLSLSLSYFFFLTIVSYLCNKLQQTATHCNTRGI